RAMLTLATILPPPPNSRTDLQRHTHRRSENRLATPLQRHLPPLIPPRCRPRLWPAHRQIPIAERAAPPNTCPFPRFRPLEVFGRRPPCVGKRSSRPASENLHTSGRKRQNNKEAKGPWVVSLRLSVVIPDYEKRP